MSSRSTLPRDALRVGVAAGFGVWAVGTALILVAVWWVQGPGFPRLSATTAYHQILLWFITIQHAGAIEPLVSGLGAAVWAVVAAGGAVALWLFDGEVGPRAVIALGAGFGVGHAVGFAAVAFRWGPAMNRLSAPWSLLVVPFGGFVLPAALATVGVVGAVVVSQFRE